MLMRPEPSRFTNTSQLLEKQLLKSSTATPSAVKRTVLIPASSLFETLMDSREILLKIGLQYKSFLLFPERVASIFSLILERS